MLKQASLGYTCATTWVVSMYAHSPCMGFVRKQKFKFEFLVLRKTRVVTHERQQDSGAKVCSVRGFVPQTKNHCTRSILYSNAGKFYDGHPKRRHTHSWITVEGLAKSVGVTEEEMKGHLTYMLGLLGHPKTRYLKGIMTEQLFIISIARDYPQSLFI